MQLSDLAAVASLRVVRDAAVGSLGFVTHPGANLLAFVESERFVDKLLANGAVSCVIATEALADAVPRSLGLAVAANPRRAFYAAHNHLARNTDFYWKPFATSVEPDARVSPRAYVAETDVSIGHRVLIEPGAVVRERTILGDDVVLRAGCVIGTAGFQYQSFDEEVLTVDHAGGVVLRNRVEIQNNSNVNRAVFGGFTEIGEDSKIDSLVHVGHNACIGRRTMVAALTVIGGSTSVGDDVWIGPGCCISTEIRVGDGARVTLGSVVTRDVPPGGHVTGNFAIDHDKFIAFLRSIR